MIALAVKANPFYQSVRQWQVRVFVMLGAVTAVEEAFGDIALAVSSFETSEERGEWYVEILTDVPPQNAAIESRLALVSGILGITTPKAEIRALAPRDWVSEVERSFMPFTVGRFYVHGSHARATPPPGLISLQINAGSAFGSGEHATTSSCLTALSLLAKRRRFSHALDMGCGSGILAIAMAKLWKQPVLGVDIDPVSVSVARRNARINRSEKYLRFVAGDGYRSALVKQCAPFDLIVANILARPLVRMAPLLAANLASGGIAVLSGLLASQERMVLGAHRVQELGLHARVRIGQWCTLILHRRNA